MGFIQHRADPYEWDVSRCCGIRYPATFHVYYQGAAAVMRATLGSRRKERFVHGQDRSFQDREARLSEQHRRAGRMESSRDGSARPMEVGVSHHDLTGMKMRVERARVSQGDEQPAWRGVEKVYDLFGRTAPYADNACARALVAAAQPSQFTPGRGNRQESSRDGAGTHVIPLMCEVPAERPVVIIPAGLGKPRSA